MNAAETRALLLALNTAWQQGLGAAIATVVGVQGSAYRREGTRMLILEDGSQVCMLSGGCLEAEVVEVALDVIRTGQPSVTHYDLSEDATWGLGIGCGGSVDVRIERVNPSDAVTLGWLNALEQGQLAALVVPLNGSKNGSRSLNVTEQLLVTLDQSMGQLASASLEAFAVTAARERLRGREPKAITLLGPERVPVFIDVNVPPPQLVLFGAGHDAKPLALQAVALGYDVHVIDAREAYLTMGRFPECTLHLLGPDELLSKSNLFQPSARSHLIIMNHHLDRDRLCLAYALRSGAEYVGVLGPRSRAQQLLEELEASGETFSAKQLACLRAPVGLKLGAEAPEEVALSILAELMAWRRGYDGSFLSGHAGRIHEAQIHEAQIHEAQIHGTSSVLGSQ